MEIYANLTNTGADTNTCTDVESTVIPKPMQRPDLMMLKPTPVPA
jgi:hypothetical protein